MSDAAASSIGGLVAYGENSKPSHVEAWLEQRFHAYRFGVVLILLFATFVFTASGIDGAWAQVASIALQALTLLAALLASRIGRRLFRVAATVSLLALASAVVAAIASSSDDVRGGFFALGLLLVAGAPLAIGRALWRRQIVDVHTVLGAICIYVLIGMFFSFLYSAIGLFGDEAFFVQTAHANASEFLYFSFITLCTVGYGDFTPANGLGRALASLEALLGQLYLVTIIAVLVSRMVPRQREGTAADSGAADDTSRAA